MPIRTGKSRLSLHCPGCDEEIQVPFKELAVGHAVFCGHCGDLFYLDHARESLDEPLHWSLEPTVPDERYERS